MNLIEMIDYLLNSLLNEKKEYADVLIPQNVERKKMFSVAQ